MKRTVQLLVVIAILGALFAGCGKINFKGSDGEDVSLDLKKIKDGDIGLDIEGEDGETQRINMNSDEDGNATMTMETKDGTFESNTGENTELPEGFPGDFPLPNDAKFEMATTMAEDGKESYSIYFSSENDQEVLFTDIKEYAVNKGMEINVEQISESDGQKTYMLNAGLSESEFFQVSIGYLEQNKIQVLYSVPK